MVKPQVWPAISVHCPSSTFAKQGGGPLWYLVSHGGHQHCPASSQDYFQGQDAIVSCRLPNTQPQQDWKDLDPGVVTSPGTENASAVWQLGSSFLFSERENEERKSSLANRDRLQLGQSLIGGEIMRIGASSQMLWQFPGTVVFCVRKVSADQQATNTPSDRDPSCNDLADQRCGSRRVASRTPGITESHAIQDSLISIQHGGAGQSQRPGLCRVWASQSVSV